ncbi:hypothetical protein FNF29_05526 [Cafeteria roenbergensis]|uniref:Uncharacterized protein n=1 Tax=Cafeteria roenbergensis TaxID=33653 RepID=A0A5A8CAD9_CAFRO|nr:hypothetical protein FNF29_05526 [Cafeteria roenbergensis]|eukprot:KAA0150086.1 hypothetical protein FNF29_05526 [Cafeteria roenbergensis]
MLLRAEADAAIAAGAVEAAGTALGAAAALAGTSLATLLRAVGAAAGAGDDEVVGWPGASKAGALDAAAERGGLVRAAVAGMALCRLHHGQPADAAEMLRGFLVAAPPVTMRADTVYAAFTLIDLSRAPREAKRDKDALRAVAARFGVAHFAAGAS